MRLIDADALKAYIDMQYGRPFIGCTIGEAFKIMTDEQPTVQPELKDIIDATTVLTAGRHTTDAIPVEWIRKQAEEFPGMESAMWNKLLRLWEKKNEYEDLYES